MLSLFSDKRGWLLLVCAALALTSATACRRKSESAKEAAIAVYGFSIVKESLDTAIFPAFAADWERKTGQKVSFTTSFAGSETITNQIIAGVDADVAILSIERHADRIVKSGITKHEWRKLPYGGIVNRTPMVILTQAGNPKKIRDFADLAKPGVRLLHADPSSSGGGQWSLLAVYGSELIKSEKQTGKRDEGRAFKLLQGVWRNVIATFGSAREARTHFERGEADALITYELEGLLLKDKRIPCEIVMPPSTVMCEHPAVIITQAMTPTKYALVELFVRSLWDRDAQAAWVKSHFRSVTDEKLNEGFTKVEMPFYAKDLGGWDRFYTEVVEGVWKQKIQAAK